MLEDKQAIKDCILGQCNKSSFVKKCGIGFTKLECGSVGLDMVIDEDMTNPYGFAHGGALVTLLDTCMGIACFTVGKRVVTLELKTNYLRPAPQGCKVHAVSQLLHNGKTTLVVRGDILNEEEQVLATATATFYVISVDEQIPAQW